MDDGVVLPPVYWFCIIICIERKLAPTHKSTLPRMKADLRQGPEELWAAVPRGRRVFRY
jgi:hypothetical protein